MTVFDEIDAAPEDAADAEAQADVAAGRVISHEAVKAWLLSRGTAEELPPPTVGEQAGFGVTPKHPS
jgi:predicted transcriptional regulator